MNIGVVKLWRLIFLLFFALCLSHTLAAQPIIKQIKITNSDCKNNGIVEIVATGIVGNPVYKLDKMKLDAGGNPTDVVESTQQNTGVGKNQFYNLEEGKYYAYIYDDVTGLNGVKSDLAVVKSTYLSFLGNVTVTEEFSSTTTCGNSGAVNFVIATDKPGKAPYSYVLTNNETGQKSELLNTNATNNKFNQLPAGTYSYTVSDACGSSFYSNNLVVETRKTAKDIEVVSFKSPRHSVSDNGGMCSRMTLYMSNITTGIINETTGADGLAKEYARDFEYQVDYPIGSNTWKHVATGVSGYFYLYINDFDSNSTDPDNLKYKVRVVNKCNGSMAEDPTVYEFGKATTTFTFSHALDYKELDLCSVPDSSEVTITPIKKIGAYSCLQPGKYPLTITLTQRLPAPEDPANPPVLTYVWNEENTTPQGKYKIKVAANITYSMTIVDGEGATLYSTYSYVARAYKPDVYLESRANSVNICDPTSSEIAFRLSLTTPANGNISYNYIGHPITFKMMKSPEGVVIPADDSIRSTTTRNPSAYVQLWENYPAGTYEIQIDKGCEAPQTTKFTISNLIARYEPFQPVSEAVGCKQHSLMVGAQFYDEEGKRRPTAHFIYIWWYNPIKKAYVFKERLNSYVNTDDGWYATKPMLETGKFIVRYVANSSYSQSILDDGKCEFARYEIEVNEIYKAPEIILPESGGISCTLGGGANFTVAAENSITRPFTYQIKPHGAPDSQYSVAQKDSVFTNIIPGEYDVKLNTNCDGTMSSIVQTMQMYDGVKDKFMSLTGSFLNGQACSEQSATFSVKTVGPLESYQWFKEGVALTGVITDASGRTYTIPNVTKDDIGIYTVRVNTGYCFLESSDTIKSILPTPQKPIIIADCADDNAVLTVLGLDNESTFIWYKDGNVIKNNSTNTCVTTGRGYYAVVERTPTGCLSFPSDPAVISYREMYWENSQHDGDWNNPANWVDENGAKLLAIPGVCTTVHIRGNRSKATHPSLHEYTDTYGKPTCETIVFHYGSQLRYPHVLKYKKALIQYNFGYYNGNNVVDGQPTGNIEAAYQAIYRGNWKLLAAPMKSMVTGDFSVGGYPFTWQSQLNTVATGVDPASAQKNTARNLTEASFSLPFTTNDILLNTSSNAFAIKIATYGNAVGYNDHKFLETHKGIVEYPYHDNQDIMNTRPGYWLDRITGDNYLSYFDTKTLQTIMSPIGKVRRGDEAYRFIFENDKNVVDTIRVAGIWKDKPGYTQTVTPVGSDLVMIGNPFMASVDFEKFAEYNSDVIDGNAGYYTFSADNIWSNNSSGYIEPLDAFVVKLKTTNTVQLIFPMELTLIDLTRSAGTKAAGSNRLSIGATIGKEEKGDRGELIETTGAVDKLYVPKLIYPEGHTIPEVYFVSPTGKMNLRQGFNTNQTDVVLGVKCSNIGEPITLTFHDVDALGNGDSKPVLIDKFLNITQDLSENDHYTFYQRPIAGKEQYADNTRFVISFREAGSFVESNIDIRLRDSNVLHVVSNSNISTVTIFDLQGRNLFSKSSIATTNYQQSLTLAKGVYIVKATTTDGESKSHKISIK